MQYRHRQDGPNGLQNVRFRFISPPSDQIKALHLSLNRPPKLFFPVLRCFLVRGVVVDFVMMAELARWGERVVKERTLVRAGEVGWDRGCLEKSLFLFRADFSSFS